jgi:hypothetical protein
MIDKHDADKNGGGYLLSSSGGMQAVSRKRAMRVFFAN